jgi:hypothetical protein
MKSKEQVLNGYYTIGADGMPEIAADGLLKAMEEYRLQAEENAFAAARKLNGNVPAFTTFADYKASLEVKTEPVSEPADDIRLIADSILPQFLPDDATAKSLTFSFKTGGIQYTAHYTKNTHGYWDFEKAE